jgi:signal transduction histidine kinase
MNDAGETSTNEFGVLGFDISPEVVFRLGDELITDELQALVELVKNSYDASAHSAVVKIDSREKVKIPRSGERRKRDSIGWVEVGDDGDGMTHEQLKEGWLLISTPGKRSMKEEGKTNRLGRTPLGDKGLGRLGVLRLGLQVEIRTRPRTVAEEHILRFTRYDFEREHLLSQVQPHYERRPIAQQDDGTGQWSVESPYAEDVSCGPIEGRQGTVIRVSALIDPEAWRDLVHVQQGLLSLVSPFREIGGFNITVHLDDPTGEDPLPLGQLADARRELAELRWAFDFDAKRMFATGRFKLNAFAPSSSNETLHAFWQSQVAPDQGTEFRRRLIDGPLGELHAKALDAPWWLSVQLTVALADVTMPGDRKPREGKEWANPGPFSGELDSYSLSSDSDFGGDEQVFDSWQLYRRWVRDVRGVKVFRDGFGVRVGDDFLGLGAGFTGGRSFWALRPGNVVGFVEFSARDNAQLRETTDREGFVLDPPFQTFKALMHTLIDRINLTQTQIGRALTSWADEVRSPARVPPSRRAAEIAREATAREESTRSAVSAVGELRSTLAELSNGTALLTPEQTKRADEAGHLLAKLEGLVDQSQSLRRDLDELAASSAEVERERAELRDQLRVAYQTVGLGIVAETVAHEMTNITGRLEARVKALSPKFKGPEQRAARALASEAKATIRAIRQQVRHLEPQLRYQRTQRQVLDVLVVAEDVANYHGARLAPQEISVTTQGDGFKARLNQGRLQQALDNLIINSEYWLGHAGTTSPRVELTAASPRLIVRDNGPGVDPALQASIFEPFVSGRSGEAGRGLGLFIARQVLRDDQVTIYLGEREPDGRCRSFVLDFSGAIPDVDTSDDD